MRERDIRREIASILEATGAYDSVYIVGLSAGDAEGVGDRYSVAIDPAKDVHEIDDELAGCVVVYGRIDLNFIARDNDDRAADVAAERLLLVAANALNGHNLGGLTLPVFTRIAKTQWVKRVPPERKKLGVFEFAYLAETWTSFGVDP